MLGMKNLLRSSLIQRNILNTGSVSRNLIKYKTQRHTTQAISRENNTDASFKALKRVDYDQGLTDEQKLTMKRFDIFRFDSSNDDGIQKYMSYYLNLKECGPMFLDALIKIKDEVDPTLSFRRSCREGICGSCSMNIDGRNTLACLSYIESDITKESVCRPLPYFQVMRDLVVDMTNFYTQYKSIHPVLQRKTPKAEGQKEYLQTEEERAKLDSKFY